jgi:UDP-N-acetyl-D-mannosaminuronate dehydrogenase
MNKKCDVKLGVIGLGYVGLTTSGFNCFRKGDLLWEVK